MRHIKPARGKGTMYDSLTKCDLFTFPTVFVSIRHVAHNMTFYWYIACRFSPFIYSVVALTLIAQTRWIVSIIMYDRQYSSQERKNEQCRPWDIFSLIPSQLERNLFNIVIVMIADIRFYYSFSISLALNFFQHFSFETFNFCYDNTTWHIAHHLYPISLSNHMMGDRKGKRRFTCVHSRFYWMPKRNSGMAHTPVRSILNSSLYLSLSFKTGTSIYFFFFYHSSGSP